MEMLGDDLPRGAEPQKLLLTLSEAAKIIGLCEKTLRAEMNASSLRYITVGRSRHLTRIDIDEWISAKRKEWESVHVALANRQPRPARRKASKSFPTLAEASALLKSRKRNLDAGS